MERGLPEEAAVQFRAALALAGTLPGGFPSEPLCRAYLGRLEPKPGR